MVRTPRHATAPLALSVARARWTIRFLRIHRGERVGDWATSTAKRVLKEPLDAMAHGKCVYCESALNVTAALQIDHYVPKSVYPDDVLTWDNLLPACSKCNGAKGEEDHGGTLLKPDIEDPELFFWIHPDTGALQPHPSLDADSVRRASETIRICDLQRGALCTQRVQMARRVARWLERLERLANDEMLPDLLREEWAELSDPSSEYKLVLRDVLKRRGQQQLADGDRTRYERPV
jgi:uncharacterized protein (TIGR02646 family)